MLIPLITIRLMHNATVNTYESSSTQAFKGGRTETLRSVTPESKLLIDNIIKNNLININDYDKQSIYDLLQNACKAHSIMGANAANGKGFDRHLFALNFLAIKRNEENNIPLPNLFKSKAFKLLQSNVLSTSSGFIIYY